MSHCARKQMLGMRSFSCRQERGCVTSDAAPFRDASMRHGDGADSPAPLPHSPNSPVRRSFQVSLRGAKGLGRGTSAPMERKATSHSVRRPPKNR